MDNSLIPEETLIYNSKNKVTKSWILLGIAVLIYAAYWYFYKHSAFMAIMFILCATYILYAGIKKLIDKAPQITLNNKGISTANTSFKTWAEITGEDVYTIPKRSYNGGANFIYYFNNGSENVYLEPLNVTEENFKLLIKTYRQNSRKLHPELYINHKEQNKKTEDNHDYTYKLSESQQNYQAKNTNKNSYKKNDNTEISRLCHPFLIFFCLVVFPAAFDKFAPLKIKDEIVKDVTYGKMHVKTSYSSGNLPCLKITTERKEYTLYGNYKNQFNEIYKGDTLSISKTQILNIPLKFKSRYIVLESHENDYLIFYSSLLVICMFLISLLLKSDTATLIIFGISIVSTIICFFSYI